MPQKLRFWIAFVLLTAICFVDYQYFTEGVAVNNISPQKRQLFHLLIFVIIIPIGYWGWAKHPFLWLRKFWLVIYFSVLGLLLVAGGVQATTHIFGVAVLDFFSSIRLFFTSPMPYLILLFFSRFAVISREEKN